MNPSLSLKITYKTLNNSFNITILNTPKNISIFFYKIFRIHYFRYHSDMYQTFLTHLLFFEVQILFKILQFIVTGKITKFKMMIRYGKSIYLVFE